jgi:23S rRNA (guanine1835-N2)-methyltransferase
MTRTINTSVWHSPCGKFNLARYPARNDKTLLAWCAADALLLEEARHRGTSGAALLVVNDAYGALCVALQPQALWTDSALAALALRRNERANGRPATPIVWSTHTPVLTPELVVLRIPKQLPYFEYQLSQIARWLPAGATLLAAGMDKHLSPHTARIMERSIGPTLRHPGQRKARLFSAVRDDRELPPGTGTTAYYCEPLGAELHSLANVFCREKLDLGTRFLLEQYPRLTPVETVIDLACGNGVLGLTALVHGLAQRTAFCDESAMAVASAQGNACRLLPRATDNCSFHHGDALLDYPGEAAQLILCNPPFHAEHAVDEFAGWHLLAQCSHHLAPGGKLCLVANRHLDYVSQLRRQFQHVEKFASNAKFNILLARQD